MISGQRNMFLLSSVALIMYGFCTKYQGTPVVFKYLSIVWLVLAAFIGIHASYDFEYYLDNVGELPKYYSVARWRLWKYVANVYGAFLIALAIYVFVSDVMRRGQRPRA